MKVAKHAYAMLLAASLLLPSAAPVLAQAMVDETGATVIQMPGSYFEPFEITVPTGTTIKWVNTDVEQHNVVARDLSYESPLIQPGEHWTFTYTSPGTYPYVCDLHAGMDGVIIVADAPVPAAPAAEAPPEMAPAAEGAAAG
ncbi:MAG TPA: cupredoxin domain-containing protein [Chloroflexota bacterium]|jgi:plastocyanin|nr:cupredoxin domain-containing protein [Chloroflexota bacterium]